MQNITCEFATEKDLRAIKELLRENQLPYEDIDEHVRHFMLAKDAGKIIGTISIENLGKCALLRSLAIDIKYRNKGIGKDLCNRIKEYWKQLGISEVYLLTTTAGEYFKKLGFAVRDRGTVPEPIKKTLEFSSLCPLTAICMYQKIN